MVSRRAFFAASLMPMLRSQERKAAMFQNADAYERFMGRWSRRVAQRLLDFAPVPDSGQALDLGCGTGSLAFAIAGRTKATTVIGVDPSAEYVAYAGSRNSFARRVNFQVGDAQQLNFGDAVFTATLSLLVFNFIPDPRKALTEARRVTKPHALISAAVWDYGGRMDMLRTFWDAASDTDPGAAKLDEKHMPLCRSGELARLWKEGGLENVREQSLEASMAFASFNDYWEPFLLGQGPAGAYVRTLTPPRQLSLRDAVKKRLRIRSEDQAFTMPSRVWAVRGNVPAA